MTVNSTLRGPKRAYQVAIRLEAIALLETMSDYKVSAQLGIPRRTIRSWADQRDDILAYTGNKKRMKLSPGGRSESFPDPTGLVEFIAEMRARDGALTTTHIINWIKRFQPDWLRLYLADKEPGMAYQSLLRLLQLFCNRHGYSRQRAGHTKKSRAALTEVRDEFAEEFHRAYSAFDADAVYNVDETGFHYDMPPRYIWSIRGGDAKVSSGEKHSLRMTVALTVRADGTKMPLLFVVRGQPGGQIATNELPTYPAGHVYAVQPKAWMDNDVWLQYLRDLLLPCIEAPSVILVDNFESHVSDESYDIVQDELSSLLVPMPPNATSVCQPLDVGVMAPFKRLLRDEWLAEEIIDGDDGHEFDSPCAAQKRLAMIKRAISAWEKVSEDVIRQSFAKAIPRT
ncbi:hypothetical protein DYB35_008734 [Aphanomyces astaci]|uniref:DDE-1 domain-containing protein n=1 Tax=Aphanomyces astaci TaxID=112090 RepID=A0A3R6WJK5_APHAT|nr:hypothetical protein DYB35_008734 [Aphanomyces astaci]